MKKEKETYLDVRLDLSAEFLEVLNDGRVDGAAEVGVLVCNATRFVSDVVVYVL